MPIAKCSGAYLKRKKGLPHSSEKSLFFIHKMHSYYVKREDSNLPTYLNLQLIGFFLHQPFFQPLVHPHFRPLASSQAFWIMIEGQDQEP